VLLLEANHHPTEVLTDEVLKKGLDAVAFLDVILVEKLVGEVGTCFEGEALREAEGVVTVKEDILDLVSELVFIAVRRRLVI
jgi:hypothetical protein